MTQPLTYHPMDQALPYISLKTFVTSTSHGQRKVERRGGGLKGNVKLLAEARTTSRLLTCRCGMKLFEFNDAKRNHLF